MAVHPITKRMKDTLVGLGVPRKGLTTITDMGATRAAHLEAHHIAERAEQIAATGWIGVVISARPCGCVITALATNDSRHAGTVRRRTTDIDSGTHIIVGHGEAPRHQCPTKETQTAMTSNRPEPAKGPTPEQQAAEGELAKHAFETAGKLRLLVEHMEALTWRTDEYTIDDLARVADSLSGMAIRAAMSSGDDDVLRAVTGRPFRRL